MNEINTVIDSDDPSIDEHMKGIWNIFYEENSELNNIMEDVNVSRYDTEVDDLTMDLEEKKTETLKSEESEKPVGMKSKRLNVGT